MQSLYFVRRQHDGVKMQGEFVDMDNAIFHANRCVAGSSNTAAYEIVRTKDNIIIAIVESDHSVGYTND